MSDFACVRTRGAYSIISDAVPPAYGSRNRLNCSARSWTSRGIKHAPWRAQGAKSPIFPAHDAQFLHHHGGAVFLLARRQRAADRRHRPARTALGPGVDDAAATVLLHRFL